MSNPLDTLTCVPFYGKQQAVLRWNVTDPKYLSGNFVVQKSPDGYSNWSTITSGTNLTSYTDSELKPDSYNDVTHYKVILQYNGYRYETNAVGFYTSFTHPKEFALLRRMIQLEYKDYRSANGVELLLLKPLRSGELSSNVDSLTNQSRGNSQNENTYGNLYEGGYDEPIQFFAKFLSQEKRNTQTDPKGTGYKSINMYPIRCLSYPVIHVEDLVVNTKTDERYVVGSVEVFKFKGVVPFVCHSQLQLLDKSDIRYKLKV